MITFSKKAAATLSVMPPEELGRRATVTRLAPVIAASIVTDLNGLPYPVQYRNLERKLIFVAPIMVRADLLAQEPLQPKTYRAR